MGRYKAVRQADVAERAGVSTSTVSHVLRGTRFVDPETRRRVDDALDELGYRRDDRPSTRAIGLAVTAASNPYVADLILGVEAECRRAGYALLLCDTHDDPSIEFSGVRSLLQHRVDGLVLGPTGGWRRRTLPLLAGGHTPFVLVDRVSRDVACDQIGVESQSTSDELVTHLLALGHRRIGMVTGLPGISTTRERVRGYRTALRRAGVHHVADLEQCGQSTVAGGRKATLAVLDHEPTALFVGNNAMTIGAMLALSERRVSIPGDVALVSFDDLEWAEAVQPPLTSAAQPFHAVGAQAVQALTRRLADPRRPPHTELLPASIEHRGSCGCVPGTPLRHQQAAG